MEPQNVSLFASLWPAAGTEREQLDKQTILPTKGNPSWFKSQYKNNLKFARLALTLCQQAAESIVSNKYTNFDALIKNHGCQITALYMQKQIKEGKLREEAERVAQAVSPQLKEIAKLFAKPPLGEFGMDILSYLRITKTDVELSSEMASLVRHRLLNIILGKQEYRDEEVFWTDLAPLICLINTLEPRCEPLSITLGTWIQGIQVEEAQKAAQFIRDVADELPEEEARTVLVKKMLTEPHLRKTKKRIVALPQSYSTEAAIKGVKGILLVKNKLTLCGQRIEGANPNKVFLEMPSERVLNEDEVKALPAHEPLVVLEGYAQYNEPLAATILKAGGLIELVNRNLVKNSQYTESFPQTPLDDVEAQEDLKKYLVQLSNPFRCDQICCASIEVEAQEDLKKYLAQLPNPFRCDHMFCASVEEEGRE